MHIVLWWRIQRHILLSACVKFKIFSTLFEDHAGQTMSYRRTIIAYFVSLNVPFQKRAYYIMRQVMNTIFCQCYM